MSFFPTRATIPAGLPDPAPELGEISGSLTAMMPFLAGLAGLAGLAMAIVGIFRVMRSQHDGYTEGWGTVVLGFALGGSGFLVNFLVGPILAEETPQVTPSEKPSSTPSTAPESIQPPVDLTWLWIVLGILAALILTVLLIWVITAASVKTRRGIRETRERLEAERAATLRLTSSWQRFHDRHNELLRKILHSETDWDSLFYTPALTDPNVPQTYRMLRAMQAANTLRDTAGELPANLTPDADLTKLPYPRAIEEFALAWDAAERHARRLGQKGVPHAERKIIKQIRTLLDMAENGAASQNERNLAYRRAQSLIESLETIHVPAQAIAQLEERHQLMLTSS